MVCWGFFKNIFHAFILQLPLRSVPFKLQVVLTEEFELTSHNKFNTGTSSITTPHVFMSTVKKQYRTYSVPELLLQSAHKAVLPATTILVPTVRIPVCQTVFGDHLLISEGQPKASADTYSSPSLPA